MSQSRPLHRVRWYWNRLRCMSPGEVGHRVQQKAFAQLQRWGLATARRAPDPDLSEPLCNFVSFGDGISARPYVGAADEILTGRLRIFAMDHVYGATMEWNRDPKTRTMAPLIFGKTLNYRNPRAVGDIKYLWEPNRHLHLVTLAQAYHLTGDRRYLQGLRRQLESWFDQCPYLKGPNWTSSLELAIRLINWSIAWQLIGALDCAAFQGEDGQEFRDRWLTSIYRHMQFVRGNLSRYSSANNHLIGELAGLYVGASTWPFWPKTRKWGAQTKKELLCEALLQNAPDGVNREQAISYQQFVLDFLIIAGLAARAKCDDFSDGYWERIEVMLEFIASVMDVNGNVPMIGDADDGYVVRLSQEPDFCPYRSLLATAAVLFERGDFKRKAGRFDDKSRWLFGSRGEEQFRRLESAVLALPRRAFPEGGYYILGCEFDTDKEVRIVVDAGPLGYLSIAAHGHADALAFTLSVGGHEFLIDPGTYAYHTDRKWRDYFRGTSAHNTLAVDGENQSAIGGSFMWTRKANATCESWEPGDGMDRFVGVHDGYMRLPDPVIHRREICLTKPERKIVITDILECLSTHLVQCYWHFSEACDVALEEASLIVTNVGITIKLSISDPRMKFEIAKGRADPPIGWVSHRFDVKAPTTTAVGTIRIHGTHTLCTEITCE